LAQAKWMALSSLLLFGYVFAWYKALKLENASLVTCFLVPASLITTLLNSVFVTGRFTLGQAEVAIFFSVALLLLSKFRSKTNAYEPAAKTT
jgi:drug/metabolite transporter (DMT)-like permease